MKRLFAILFAMAFFLTALPQAAASEGGKLSVGLDDEGSGRYRTTDVDAVQFALNGIILDSDVPAFIQDGRTMVPVRVIAEAMRATVDWDGNNREVTITLNERTVKLKIGSAQAWVNGSHEMLYGGVPAMITKYNGIERTVVPLRFVSEQLGCSVTWDPDTRTANVVSFDSVGKTIVVDAGHGGGDGGAFYEDVAEKSINLAVAFKLQAILERCGFNVIMTRSTDKFVGLKTRASIANNAGADVFVSLHANVIEGYPNYSGTYTYYYWSANGSRDLAKSIQAQVCGATKSIDRGVLYGDLSVLRNSTMSAALVEMGYMTCHEELQNLITPEYQDKLAEGIAQGIINYLNEK